MPALLPAEIRLIKAGLGFGGLAPHGVQGLFHFLPEVEFGRGRQKAYGVWRRRPDCWRILRDDPANIGIRRLPCFNGRLSAASRGVLVTEALPHPIRRVEA